MNALRMTNPNKCQFIDTTQDRIAFVLGTSNSVLEQTEIAAGARIRELAEQAYAKHGTCKVFVLASNHKRDRATGKDEVTKFWLQYNWKNKNTGTHYKRAKMSTVEQSKIPNMLKMVAMLVGA